jgi:hypothetical protein
MTDNPLRTENVATEREAVVVIRAKGEGVNLEAEVVAIEAISKALAPLEPTAQRRVLNYVLSATGLSPSSDQPSPNTRPDDGPSPPGRHKGSEVTPDIRSFREAKQPKNGSEMAAVLAYYLSEVAPPAERKTSITSSDIEKYFKQAGFPLPSRSRDALRTAPGFLEKTSSGEYRLTSVGHNLVVHKLPGKK